MHRANLQQREQQQHGDGLNVREKLACLLTAVSNERFTVKVRLQVLPADVTCGSE